MKELTGIKRNTLDWLSTYCWWHSRFFISIRHFLHNYKVLSFHIYHPLIYFDDAILFHQLLHSWQFAELHPSDDVLPFAFLKPLRKEIASEDHRSKNKIDIRMQNQKVTEKSLFTESVMFAMIFVCWEAWYQSCVQIAVRKKKISILDDFRIQRHSMAHIKEDSTS